MSEAIQPQPRTPEQLAAVRRRALPVAIAGVTFGVAAILLLIQTQVDVRRPPNVLAPNLSFCAIMMGVGILFYAKGAPGTGLARMLCAGAILFGLAGPVIFARQSLLWHQQMENREAENAAVIAKAAGKFAADHGGAYPKDFMELLSGKYIEPERLLSPFGGQGSDYIGSKKITATSPDWQAVLAEHSDYTYAGGDLHLPLSDPAKIIVVYETEPVMRTHFAVGFGDGRAEFLDLPEAQTAMSECNDARKKMGLKELEEPESVKRALEGEK